MTREVLVLEPGPLTTVQDLGRTGWAHLGVPRSGALDRGAAAAANRLVGNPDDAAVLETTLGGVALRVSAAMAVAVTGAECEVSVDGVARAPGFPLPLSAGQRLVVGPARRGLRSYVGLAGGVVVDPVLGSRSTDTLSGLGPPPLAADQRLPVGPPASPPPSPDVPALAGLRDRVVLRVDRGPRDDWFTEDALATLTSAAYAVSPDSNRVGLRLHGPALPRREPGAELPSEGIVLGSVQVPASGEPLVFLGDHPTTGGYPVVGVVRARDLDLCAQLRPGEPVRFSRGWPGPAGPGRGPGC